MSGLLLDTNVLIDLTHGRSASVTARFAAALAAAESLTVSVISLYEYRFGAERSVRREGQLAALERFLAVAEVLGLSRQDAEAAALIKADLAAKGRMIGAHDLLLAGQARARDLTVVTGNVREFGRIPGLAVENWSQSE